MLTISWSWWPTSILALRKPSPLNTNPAAGNSHSTDISLKLLRQWGWSDLDLAWIQFRTWHRGCWSQEIFPLPLVGLDEDSGDVCVRSHKPLTQLTSTQVAAFRAMFQVLPRGNGPQNQASKCAHNQAERAGQLWDRVSSCVLFITMDPTWVSSKPGPTFPLKQKEMPPCQGQAEPSPCSLPSPSLFLPTAKPPTVGFDSETRFGTSALLAGEMAIKAHTCFLFHSAAGLEQWKVIYAEKDLFKENDAMNAVPTKLGMGKGRKFTAHRSAK